MTEIADVIAVAIIMEDYQGDVEMIAQYYFSLLFSYYFLQTADVVVEEVANT